MIPINERHLKVTIKEWGLHYNRGRPHSSLGPGIPEPNQDSVPASDHRHKLPAGYRARCPHRFGQEVRLSECNNGPVGCAHFRGRDASGKHDATLNQAQPLSKRSCSNATT